MNLFTWFPQARKTLLVPTPRLRTGLFNRIVPPPGATKEILRRCATSQVGMRDEGRLGLTCGTLILGWTSWKLENLNYLPVRMLFLGLCTQLPLVILKSGENLVLAGQDWYFSVLFGKSWATWGELDLSSCSYILQFWAAESSGECFSALRCYQIGKTRFILESIIQRTANRCVCSSEAQTREEVWVCSAVSCCPLVLQSHCTAQGFGQGTWQVLYPSLFAWKPNWYSTNGSLHGFISSFISC